MSVRVLSAVIRNSELATSIDTLTQVTTLCFTGSDNKSVSQCLHWTTESPLSRTAPEVGMRFRLIC